MTEPSGTDSGTDGMKAARWTWSLSGTELGNGSPGAARHDVAASGTSDVEMAGEVLIELAERGQFWDLLDTGRPFTFTVSRGGDNS